MEGVADILHLNNFSEMSLIHTLRTRYQQVRSRARNTPNSILVEALPLTPRSQAQPKPAASELRAGLRHKQPTT